MLGAGYSGNRGQEQVALAPTVPFSGARRGHLDPYPISHIPYPRSYIYRTTHTLVLSSQEVHLSSTIEVNVMKQIKLTTVILA